MTMGKLVVVTLLVTTVAGAIYASGKLEAKKEMYLREKGYKEGYRDAMDDAEEVVKKAVKES